MRRSLTTLVIVVAALALTATSVLAANPKWNKGPFYNATTSSLTASGKATGLANLPTSARLTAERIEVDYRCRNKGQNFAGGHPAVTENAVAETQPISPRNGQITFSVSMPVPLPSASAVCPNHNWTVIVTSVRYIGVRLALLQNGTTILEDGPHNFSAP